MFFSFKSKGSESDFLFHFKCVHVIVLNCYNFFKIIFFQLLKEKFWISRYFINRKPKWWFETNSCMLCCSIPTIQLLTVNLQKSHPKKQNVSQAYTIPFFHFPTFRCYSMLINLFWKLIALGDTVFSSKIVKRNQKWNSQQWKW